MGINTDTSKRPYFSEAAKMPEYYQVLFKPGVSVQTRELNELQEILHYQIEKFGNHIFQHGTIIDGCNFAFTESAPYVKIKDMTTLNTTAIVSEYVGKTLINQTTGLKARVNSVIDGYESNDPDLKTLYLTYLNSGTNGSVTAFASGDQLKVEMSTKIIQDIDVTNGGSGFSNSDTVIVTSAVVVNVASGTFSNGEYVTNETANLQIVAIDTTTLANSNQVILSLKPRAADLANATFDVSEFNFSNTDAIRNVSNTVTGTIEKIIGSGLRAKITTNNVGKVNDVIVLEEGERYTTLPTVTVQSGNNTTGIGNLVLSPRNHLDTIVISSVANAVGNGYAFSVSGGIIWQKGFFINVASQSVIVEKYHQSPNSVVVGFDTTETIVDSNVDDRLLDNAFTEKNSNAPGADRLKLEPTLVVKTVEDAESNNDFFTLVEWSEGQPFRQKQATEYSKINDEMAKRMSDSSGNFVVDPFLLTTRSPANVSFEANTVSLMIDPGSGYIDGYRVTTTRNYSFDIEKGIDSANLTDQYITLYYGSYVEVNNLGGTFQFSTGDSVDLYDTAKNFVANTTLVVTGNTTPTGTKIGTANIRHLQRITETNYRLYLFNINMNAGKNFRSVKSIYYNGTKKGICDVVVQYDAATSANIAVLEQTSNSTGLLFYTGCHSIKNANNVEYSYYTIDQTVSIANTGIATKDISAVVDEFFQYSQTLTTPELQTLQLIPTTADLIASNNITGTVSVAASNTLTGTGTAFITELKAGDYIQAYSNATAAEIRRVATIANNTSLTTDTAFTIANTTAVVYRVFPQNVPIPIGYRSGITANNNANNNVLTIDLGMRFQGSGSTTASLSCKISRQGAAQNTKTANRNRFVKIRVANNAGGTLGPWCIGVPDVFRLRNVYVGNSSVNTSFTNKITNFYIDHNQTKDYYGLSYLYLKTKNNANITSDDYMLVEFDYFTNSGAGYYNAMSYVSSNVAQRYATDSTALDSLGSSINTFEIPEVDDNGTTFDLIKYFDFRPYAANTVAPAASAGSAPLNPSETLSFGNTASAANDLKFPVPATLLKADFEQFLGRIESVFVNKEGKIFSLPGKPGHVRNRLVPTDAPSGTMKIADLVIPPYPNLPIVRSNQLNKILATNVANERWLKRRLDEKTITRLTTNRASSDQPKGYTMADIGRLERRIKDVEHYVSISLLESDLKDRNIPSSTDRSLNRFKYGFFVDDFSSYLSCDRENPDFQAYIEEDDLVPEKLTWMVDFEQIVGPGPYVDELIIAQTNATKPVDEPLPPCVPATLVANSAAFRGSPGLLGEYSQEFILASAQSAPATLYFSALSTNITIEIYQGSVGASGFNPTANKTLIATAADAVPLSTTEKTKVLSNEYYNWFNAASSLLIDTVVTGSSAKYLGKITWNHNPANGRGYLIRVTSATPKNLHPWKYIFEYPIDRDTVGCPTVPPTNPPPPTPPNTWDPNFGPSSDFGGDNCGGRDLDGMGGKDFGGSTGGSDSGGGGSGGCYVTTAAIKHGDLDANDYLSRFAYFQEKFIMAKQDYVDMLSWYYRHAPKIVKLMNAHPNKEEIYAKVYEYIEETKQAVIREELDEAGQIYIAMLKYLIEATNYESEFLS